MKDFKTLLLLVIASVFIGCSSDDSIKEGMNKVHWDRDMCERCKMVVSERHFAVQLINPATEKSKMFDDLGCAVLWFKEENLDWFDKATIWINDAKTGEWINAREAKYAMGTLTPMGYGLSAYTKETFPQGATELNFDDALKVVEKIDAEHRRKRAERKAQREANKKEH